VVRRTGDFATRVPRDGAEANLNNGAALCRCATRSTSTGGADPQRAVAGPRAAAARSHAVNGLANRGFGEWNAPSNRVGRTGRVSREALRSALAQLSTSPG